MTVDELKYEIADSLDLSNDTDILFHLENMIWSWRAKLFRQKQERYHYEREWENTFDMKLVRDYSEFTDIGEDDNCLVLRTEVCVPKPVIFKYMPPFHRVSTINKAEVFTYSRPQEYHFSKHNKWTGNKNYYFYLNDYIWVINTKLLTKINVAGIFERPDKIKTDLELENIYWNKNKANYLSYEISRDIKQAVMSSDLQILRPETVKETPNDLENE